MNPSNPFADPFFARSPDTNVSTKADHCRQHRKQIREYSQSAHMKVSMNMFRFFRIIVILGFSSISAILIFGLFTRGALVGIPIGLALLAVLLFIPYYFWSRKQKVVKAIERLVADLGGSWGEKRLIGILDWFDSHWPAEHPLDVVVYVTPFENRWDWQSTFANRPLLLVINRRPYEGNSASTQNSSIERMSFFLARSGVSPQPTVDSTAALQELEELGYWVKRTEAGVFVSHAGIAPEKLEPSAVQKVLNAAAKIG